jgi:transaldolase
VTTLPGATIRAFNDHGTVGRTLDEDVEQADATIEAAQTGGIDLVDVGLALEDQGIAAFDLAFRRVLDTMRTRIRGESGDSHAA